MGWTRLELFDALSDRDSIAGPVITVAELGSNAQLIGRDFFVDAPRSGSLRFPGPPAKCSGAAWQLHRGMGAPFADADFALNEAPLPPVEPQRCSISLGLSPAVPGMGPLSGFRGVVLTQAWAGTYATQLLGLMGADVIQLEVRSTRPRNDFCPATARVMCVAKFTLAAQVRNRVDSWRGGNYTNPMPAVFRDVPTAQHPWNCNPLCTKPPLRYLLLCESRLTLQSGVGPGRQQREPQQALHHRRPGAAGGHRPLRAARRPGGFRCRVSTCKELATVRGTYVPSCAGLAETSAHE